MNVNLAYGQGYLPVELPDDIVRAAPLTACHDIGAAVNALLPNYPNGTRLAALPQGPLTISYLAQPTIPAVAAAAGLNKLFPALL